MKKYAQNCFLLLIPILLWNVIFANQLPPAFLPDIFWRDIPPLIKLGENGFRIVVMALPAFMPLNLKRKGWGTAVYLFGTFIYFLSWIVLILFPESGWSTSLIGSLAPAYTPLIWLIGIGMIGDKLYFTHRYHPWVYYVLSFIFITFHVSHTTIVYIANI
ncbi:MAG: hypothetical protein GY943_12745 [Chloroflexi bacterium]|nr:hypothetical protein [Chloroflexota bacterium]